VRSRRVPLDPGAARTRPRPTPESPWPQGAVGLAWWAGRAATLTL
jgi:hypothetical protein